MPERENLPVRPEFSRLVDVADVSGGEIVREVAATDAERAALARRFGLVGLDSLSAKLCLKPVRGELVRLSGTLTADVVQSCVVTLEPVAAHVADRFVVDYAPGGAVPEDVVAEFDALGENPPEPLVGSVLDIGEVVAEHLALALDPYPRHPEAGARGQVWGDEEVAAKESPFAALKNFPGRKK